MRLWLILLGVLLTATLLVIDPLALVGLAYSCARGGCGVRPVWLATGAAGILLAAAMVRRSPAVAPATKPSRRKAGPSRSVKPRVAARSRAATSGRPRGRKRR